MYHVIKENGILAKLENKAEAFALARSLGACEVVVVKTALEDADTQFAEDCRLSLQNTMDQLLKWLRSSYMDRTISLENVPSYAAKKEDKVLEFEVLDVTIHLFDDDDTQSNEVDIGSQLDIRFWWGEDDDDQNTIISLKDVKFIKYVD